MNIVKKIIKNTFVLSISQIISLIIGFIYFVYMARYLGVQNFGIFSFAIAFSGLFSIFTDIGLYQLTVREVARNNKLVGRYLGNAIPLKLALAIITFSVVALTINLLDYPHQTIIVVYLITLSVIFRSFSNTFYSIFAAHEMMEYQAIGQILNSFLLFFGVFIVIYKEYDILALATLYLIVSIIILGYSVIITTWKFTQTKIEFDWIFLKSMIKEALPFGFTGVFIAIFYQIDSVMLSIMDGDAAVGVYNAAYRLVFVILIIRTTIHASIFPLLARAYIEKSKIQFELISYYLFKYLFLIIFPISVGTTILANRFILLIYGTEYIGSIIALQILIWSNVIIFLNSYPRLFEVANRQIIFTKITAIGALLNIILNYFMIPIWSYIGASIATVVTEVIILIISYAIATPNIYNINTTPFPKKAISIVISGAIMGLFIMYFYDKNIWVIVLASAIIYICALWATKVFAYSDYLEFKKLINLKKG